MHFFYSQLKEDHISAVHGCGLRGRDAPLHCIMLRKSGGVNFPPLSMINDVRPAPREHARSTSAQTGSQAWQVGRHAQPGHFLITLLVMDGQKVLHIFHWPSQNNDLKVGGISNDVRGCGVHEGRRVGLHVSTFSSGFQSNSIKGKINI